MAIAHNLRHRPDRKEAPPLSCAQEKGKISIRKLLDNGSASPNGLSFGAFHADFLPQTEANTLASSCLGQEMFY